MQLDRDQRRLVCPVLDEPPIDPAGPVGGDPVEQSGVVRPEPREDWHVMRTAEDVYRIELEHAELAHEAHKLTDARRRRRPRNTEPLRCERDPPCARRAQPPHADTMTGTISTITVGS